MQDKAPKLVSSDDSASRPAPRWRTHAEIAPFLPHPIPRRQMIRLADLSKFPKYVRIGFKGEPHWLESDLVRWLGDTYGTLIPDFVNRIRRHGFVEYFVRDEIR